MPKTKPKKKSKLESFMDAAEELNDVLGLQPRISIEDTDMETLTAKIREASELITDDDKLSKGTEKVLGFVNPKGEEVEEPEKEEETEEPAEEAPEADLGELRDQVANAGKRKELLQMAMGNDFFLELEESLPSLTSGEALRGAMLKLIDKKSGKESSTNATPKKGKTASKKTASKKATPKKEPASKGKKRAPGVIATIVGAVEGAGQDGITKEEILELLIKEFPDRDPTSMESTINVQVPNRISKERFKIERGEDDRYRKI